MNFPKKVAKFEKVSFERFAIDHKGTDAKSAYENIKMPVRATKGSAGYDFFAPYDVTVKKGESVTVATGTRCEISEGYFLCVLPRSGLGFRYALSLSNTAGIIDSDYYYSENEGHILIKLSNFHYDGDIFLPCGKALAQGIFIPYGITFDDGAEGIRNGGFGSTTK